MAGARAVVHVEVGVDQADALGPVPHLLGPLQIRVVTRGPREARRDLEEAAVADRVLVVQPVRVRSEDLPQQAAAARRGVPSRRQRVPQVRPELQPARNVLVRVREVPLGGRHNGEAPECLVVVALLAEVGGEHVVKVGPDLGQQGPGDGLVVALVARVVRVVQHATHEGTGLPPIVRLREINELLRGSGVVRHGATGDGLSHTLDRGCTWSVSSG